MSTATPSRSFAKTLHIASFLAVFPFGLGLVVLPAESGLAIGASFILGALQYAALLLHTSRTIVREVSTQTEQTDHRAELLKRWSQLTGPRVLGREVAGSLAMVTTLASAMFSGVLLFLGGLLLATMSTPSIFPKNTTLTPGVSALSILISWLLVVFARRLALWAAIQTDRAALEDQQLQLIRTARAAQGGSLSEAAPAGDGGLTEIDAAAGGLDALTDRDGASDDVRLGFGADEGAAVEARHVAETVESS